ncbi:hypothetical protein Fmac_003185 [Flemingia macrophylla]|uniref:26S proteasome non-ATPase regulatory subunit 10 n=1 Tax=Flemingia macrophylla TaxID=520843 RepID=A0ABD1NM23_9FABA
MLLISNLKASSRKELLKAAEDGDTSAFESLSSESLSEALSLTNEDRRSLLHIAVASGHSQVVEILSSCDGFAGVVNSADEEGWAPLHSAASIGSLEIVQTLLTKVVRLDVKKVVIQWFSTKVLVGYCDLNIKIFKVSATALQLQLHRPHFFAILRNMKDGADVNLKNGGGRTALHYAASKGWLKIAEILISHNAKINIKDKVGCTPLHRAASTGKSEMCELLIEEGADVDAVDKAGQTPLMNAVICYNKEVALLLIRHGADVDVEDKEGYTVLGRATDEFRPILIDAAKAMLE